MKAGYLLLSLAAAISVGIGIPVNYQEDTDLWKYIEITEDEIDTFFFDLPPLEGTNCLYLEFGIRAERDAMIVLSPKNEITDDSYGIIFGAEINSFTCILKGYGTKPVVDVTTLDILTGEWQYFWIKLEGGLLSVGKDGEDEPFAQFYDDTPFKVKYVGVKSIATVSSWKFFLPGFGNFRYHQEIGQSGGEHFNFPSLPNCNCKWYLEFCVEADGNAVITFSPEDKIVNNIYQIMIGAMDNLFTCIVRINGTKPVVDVTTVDILNKYKKVCFWVSFEDGTLQFGYFGNPTPIASFTDPEPFDVSHIGVSSLGASSWTFFFPCPADQHLINVNIPGEYHFELPQLPEPHDCFYIRFGVYAIANAVITFSPINGISDDIYEVIIGAEGNSFTCIRKGKDTKPVVDVTTIDILENCWQYFWIRFKRGKLEVGREGEEEPFAVYIDPEPFEVSWVGVTSFKYPSSWKIYTHGFGREEFYYHVPDNIPFNFIFPKFHSTNFYFEFGVRAKSDAVLSFSPKNAPLKKIYQIVVGAEKNYFHCIIKDKGTKPVADFVSYLDLSLCEYKYFWVRFNNGLLELGEYGCDDPIAFFDDVDPYEVYYLSIGGMTSESWWKIYLPCDYSNYVCNGDDLHMHCDVGTINVRRALYGRENLVYCNSAGCHDNGSEPLEFCGDVFDSMAVVQQECQGEKTCIIPADESYFGDVCTGNQYLEVDYYCLGENTETACEGEELEITCDDGYINIVSALYGRVQDDICASNGQTSSSCEAEESLSKVREICQGRESCFVPANNFVFGNPCQNVSKYLQVTWTCEAEPYGGTIRPNPFVETEFTIDTPGEYTFLEHEFKHSCLYLVFGIKAKGNAFITLSPSQGLEENIYQAMFGAGGNLFVCLRRKNGTNPVVDVTYIDILQDVYQFFWLSFCDGHLSVGFYGDNTPIAAYYDDDPFPVSYVGFTTYEAESQWIFYLEYIGTFILESNFRPTPFYPDVLLDSQNGFEHDFIIRGNEDATIWLSPRPYADYEDAVLIHIGSYGNTYNYMEYRGNLVDSSHGFLLHGAEDRHFTLKYSSERLQLLNGDGYVILEANNIAKNDVVYLGFHSPDGISYWWFYDLYFPYEVSDDGKSWTGKSFKRSFTCGSEVSIDCGEKYIYIYDATYGRQNIRICREDPIFQTDGCYARHAVDYLRESCHNQNSCTYDGSQLQSYCYDTTQYFHWTYVCANEVITNRIIENLPSTRPEPPSEDTIFEISGSSQEYNFPLPQLQDDAYFIYFCVKSHTEVRIALSSEQQANDNMYVIAMNNTSCSIGLGEESNAAESDNLISGEDFRCFWVAFDNGQIALGRYDEYFPMMTFRSASSNPPPISNVGVASDDTAAFWKFYTQGFGEYRYRSDRQHPYTPNLANLPQRAFKFCFGIKAEGEAFLRVGPEDYEEGVYSLDITIGSSDNTKISLKYADWTVESEEAGVLSKDEVRYFCLVLLDDCVTLQDGEGNSILEGEDVVNYRYLRRISFYNIGFVGYWYIRGIPFRFPVLSSSSPTTSAPVTQPPATTVPVTDSPSPSSASSTTGQVSTQTPSTTPLVTEPASSSSAPSTTGQASTQPPATSPVTEPISSSYGPSTTAQVPTQPPSTTSSATTTAQVPTQPPSTTSSATETASSSSAPATTGQASTQAPASTESDTEPATSSSAPSTAGQASTQPPATPSVTEAASSSSAPLTTGQASTQPPTTTPSVTEPASSSSAPSTTAQVPTQPPTTTPSVTEAASSSSAPSTTAQVPTHPPSSAESTAAVSTSQTACSPPPEDVEITISPGEIKFELPEVNFETFELFFALKAQGCSILIFSDAPARTANSYELGLGCDSNYVLRSDDQTRLATDDTVSLADDADHHIHVIYKYGFMVVFADDGEDPILFAYFNDALTFTHFGVTGNDYSTWKFPAEGLGAKFYEVDSGTYYYLPILHADFVIPFDVRACSGVSLFLLAETGDITDKDVVIALGRDNNTRSTIDCNSREDTYDGSLLNLNDVTHFVLERTEGSSEIRLKDSEGNVVLAIDQADGEFNFVAFSVDEGVSYWYFYWCPYQFNDLVGSSTSTVVSYTQTTHLAIECDSGWIEFEGHCYLFQEERSLDLSEHVSQCESRCARLIEIDSEGEEHFARGNAPGHYGFSEFFLGVSLLESGKIGFSESHYLTATERTGYWNVDSVSHFDGSSCFAVSSDSSKWISTSCNALSPTALVCELDPANPSC